MCSWKQIGLYMALFTDPGICIMRELPREIPLEVPPGSFIR